MGPNTPRCGAEFDLPDYTIFACDRAASLLPHIHRDGTQRAVSLPIIGRWLINRL